MTGAARLILKRGHVDLTGGAHQIMFYIGAALVMETPSPLPKKQRDDKGLPAVGEQVVVRCQGYSCLAYRDAQGKWRAVNGNRELPEVLEVVLRF